MKKILLSVFILGVLLLSSNATIACDCKCGEKCDCKCEQVKNCDCDCDCCKDGNCKCKKSFKFFKKHSKVKCNCDEK